MNHKIKIKPFAQPPKPPPNLLGTSLVGVLLPSLESILERNNRSNTSREELYRAVQDLCTHGHGLGLYPFLIQALNHAAISMVQRHCYHPNGGGDVVSLFNQLWNEYTEYLACVRNIFQPLDNLFVYLPSSGTVVARQQAHVAFAAAADVPAAAAAAASSSMDTSSSPSSTTLTQTLNRSTWSLWEVGLFALYRPLMSNRLEPILDEDGIQMLEPTDARCILAHFREAMLATMTLQLDTGTFCDGSTSGDVASSSFSSSILDSTTGLHHHHHHHDMPRAIRDSIFFLQQLNTVSTGSAVLWIPTTMTTTQSLSLVTMNLVNTSFPCSIIHTHPVMQLFLQEVTLGMMHYFSTECQKWMKKMDTMEQASSLDINGINNNTQEIHTLIRHMDARLKQVHGMTHMYFYPLSGNHGDRNSITGSIQQKGLLSRIVELHLLTPLFTSSFILHPRHFYSVLDEPQMMHSNSTIDNTLSGPGKQSYIRMKNTEDPKTTATTLEPQDHHQVHASFFYIQRLYALSKRVIYKDATTSILGLFESIFPSSPTFLNSVSSILPSTDATKGLDRFKQGLIEYGQCRGLASLRPHVPTSTALDGTTSSNMANNKEILCKSIIPALLELKSHLERLNTCAFSSDETLAKSIKNVLEQVLNSNVASQDEVGNSTGKSRVQTSILVNSEGDGGRYVAELLAKFVDLRFKDPKSTPFSTSVESSKANDSETFQHVILELFRHIHSKDIFEAFYRRDLAKRLMLNKSTSIDAERSFVSKLKAECGAGYTSKMEGMFQDIELSKDVMNMYHSYSVGNAGTSDESAPIDIEVQVLTTGYWPVYPQCASLILPTHVKKQKEHFESYYNSKYQGRRIAWQHSLGSCIVRAMFPKIGMRELVVSLPQALVLMCFNDEATGNSKPRGLTISEIMKLTGIDDRSEAERVLQSLSLGRDGTRVLTKIDVDGDDKASMDDSTSQPSKAAKMKKVRRTVSDRDLFLFNSTFTSNQHRIKITNIQVKETSDERDKTNEAVSQDRLYLIDAAIVRIMKARKSMEHRTLVGEVMTQIKFPANSSDIKKRIESLIEREYLERAEDDRAQYNYLA